MKEFVIVDIETNDGPCQLRFTADDAERLIAALHEAHNQTHFSDGSSEETHIPRTELARIARFLEQALKRFEAGAEMRQ